MELLLITKVLLLLTVSTHTTGLNIMVKCSKTDEVIPAGWLQEHKSSPSPLLDLDLELVLPNKPSTTSMNVRWSINVDRSIRSITGTWIELIEESNTSKYRCQYDPPFTSQQNYSDLQKIWFNYTITDVYVDISVRYTVMAFNLPTASINAPGELSKTKTVEVPGCDNERMRNYPACSRKWDVTVEDLPEQSEIQVDFTSHPDSHNYVIRLHKRTNNKITLLNITKMTTNFKIETIRKNLKYSGPCLNLTVQIIPFFKECEHLCDSAIYPVECKVPSTPSAPQESKTHATIDLMIITGCVIAVLIMLICFCLFCRLRMMPSFSKHGLPSSSTGSVGVLIVYPAVDSIFQHAVMALANFLQGQGGLSVVIDMWQRGSLAKQGPLRWLNSQVESAEKVLIVLPTIYTSIRPNSGCIKPDATVYTVPASAPELFSLALNLVASSASDPQLRSKFWVVQLGQHEEKGKLPVELRGYEALSVPRNLRKLHQKLTARQPLRTWSLSSSSCFLCCNESTRKVREAVLRLEKSHLHGPNEELVCLTNVESKP